MVWSVFASCNRAPESSHPYKSDAHYAGASQVLLSELPSCLTFSSYVISLMIVVNRLKTCTSSRSSRPLGSPQRSLSLRIVSPTSEQESFHVESRGFGVQVRIASNRIPTLTHFCCSLAPLNSSRYSVYILDNIQKRTALISTFLAYKTPGGIEVAKEWDLYPKAKPWPGRPFVCPLFTFDHCFVTYLVRHSGWWQVF